ncbi:helix-turn-helix transcriptional regulator [Corynebacterium ciconiae]|uniref:helix-turn-helix transcriptional regulator n=1 Tax=Corynebacterium ciconiae TaxID=227319 RepID=UPI00036CC1B2|nr:helix-turn-helix transcriptional regulator [Corynebacterium ciconiae]
MQTLPIIVGRVFLVADDDNVIFWPSYSVALGQRVRTLRAMRDISQERLAELAGMHRNAVVGIERGVSSRSGSSNPRLATAYRLARALHVPVAVLLPDATTPPRRVCRAAQALPSEVDVVWPRTPEDVLPFDGSHLMIDGDDPRFVDQAHPLYLLRRQAREAQLMCAEHNAGASTGADGESDPAGGDVGGHEAAEVDIPD